VKILDFGLVRDKKSDVDLTDTGKAPGTVSYLTPEALREEPIDGRSDIYSLGIIAFEMLTGAPPFQGTPVKVAQQHLGAPVPRLESVVPELLPLGLEELVLSMLEKNPNDRISSAEELRVKAKEVRELGGLNVKFTHTGGSRDPVRDWDLAPHL
jgi:serine/threonine-protein kinase